MRIENHLVKMLLLYLHLNQHKDLGILFVGKVKTVLIDLITCFSGAEVREVDLKAVTGGIIHTKLWVVDQKHFYLGSANMDWRSLSQVKRRGKTYMF